MNYMVEFNNFYQICKNTHPEFAGKLGRKLETLMIELFCLYIEQKDIDDLMYKSIIERPNEIGIDGEVVCRNVGKASIRHYIQCTCCKEDKLYEKLTKAKEFLNEKSYIKNFVILYGRETPTNFKKTNKFKKITFFNIYTALEYFEENKLENVFPYVYIDTLFTKVKNSEPLEQEELANLKKQIKKEKR